MTHARINAKARSPKVQLKYAPKDVVKVINGLPRDPILRLMEKSGPGRKFAEPEAILRSYYLSRFPETWVPEKPHAVWGLLKENWRDLADQCGFVKVPCWQTFRTRFKLLEEEYGNETTIRIFEIKKELERKGVGKKALPIIAKHKLPRRRGQEGPRSNYQYRKDRIGKSFSLFAMIVKCGTEDLVELFFIEARWPDGRPRCPRLACGSDRVEEEAAVDGQLRRWVCLDCEEPFDIKTGTVFEGTRYSLRTILWAAYLMLQLPFGMPSLDLACLLEEEDRRLSNKDTLDITHRILTALREHFPIFDIAAQSDSSLMGYANGVEVNVIGVVDPGSRLERVEPIFGPVNQGNSSPFHDKYVDKNAKLFTDSTKAYLKEERRETVNHGKRQFVRRGKWGDLVSTNLNENDWSTSQEMLDRHRSVTATYLPLYLTGHMWRKNHRPEPIEEQLQAFVRNSHDVVLRGDDKPCDAGEVEKELAVQLHLHPPHSKGVKARKRERRSRIKKEQGAQLALSLPDSKEVKARKRRRRSRIKKS